MIAYIGIGSNLGDRQANLRDALHRLLDKVEVRKISNVYESFPVDGSAQPMFLNAVAECATEMPSHELLRFLKTVERELGRVERGRWREREIDLDILFIGDTIINTPKLTVPHPEAYKRAFVMKPMSELNPDYIAPADCGRLRAVTMDWGLPSGNGFFPGFMPGDLGKKDFVEAYLAESGGLLIRNVFDPMQTNAWHTAVRDLFRHQPEELLKYRRTPPDRLGYTPPGVESVRYGAPNAKRHFFDFAPGTPSPDPAFLMAMTALWRRLHETSRKVLSAVSSAGMPLEEITEGGSHHLRAAHYLNPKRNPAEVLFPAHFDWSMVTLFVGGAKAGLTVRQGSRWYALDVPEDAVFVGAGTMLKLYSPGIPPLRHRVMADALERTSLFFFTEPPQDTILPGGESVKAMLERLEGATRHE